MFQQALIRANFNPIVLGNNTTKKSGSKFLSSQFHMPQEILRSLHLTSSFMAK